MRFSNDYNASTTLYKQINKSAINIYIYDDKNYLYKCLFWTLRHSLWWAIGSYLHVNVICLGGINSINWHITHVSGYCGNIKYYYQQVIL